MERKILVELLDEMLLPIGFKRKGNNWVSNGEQINRIVNLQKSQFSNSFYINFGYVLNNLPLNKWKTHVEDRLGFDEKEKNKRVIDLLNLESNIPFEERIAELRECIDEKIVEEMRTVKTEEDVLRILKSRRYLYGTPPLVLKHFNLESPW